MKAYKTIKNTGIAVILDKGEFSEIHPKSKEPVGHRLALQALYSVYGLTNLEHIAFSPMYKEHIFKSNKIELHFDHCLGLKVAGEKADGFEIAGADKEYKPAIAEIRETKILLSNEEIDEPLYARYCWTNYGEATVYGINDLPLAPFRTEKDD